MRVLVKVAEGQEPPQTILSLAVGDTLAISDNAAADASEESVQDGYVAFTVKNTADTLIGMIPISEKLFWPIVLDGKPVKLDFSAENPILVEGSEINVKLMEARLTCKEFDDAKKQIGDEYSKKAEEYNGDVPDSVVNAVRSRFDNLLQEEQESYKNIVEANKDNIIPVFMLSRAGSRLTTEYMEEFLSSYLYSNHSSLAHVHQAILGEKNKSVGADLVDFEMKDIKGVTRHLSDYVGKGKYTLVDFWASWCGPCRQEMPNVKACYEEYKDKGFQVVGISYDYEQQAWEKGVQDLGITWPQLSDLKGWNNLSSNLFNIKSIPATILYGPDGKVIATDLRGEQLAEKLKELLK
ncbi:MAG: thioredoxin-like domain-containing protein [Bacteroidaceae bacterium]|nr:thioredoxin-like domain-containing protein [Paraprevotella sp.]MDY2716968.1 thioredoxin-like domain-containing protein [Bacteroidaceae bacterium]